MFSTKAKAPCDNKVLFTEKDHAYTGTKGAKPIRCHKNLWDYCIANGAGTQGPPS